MVAMGRPAVRIEPTEAEESDLKRLSRRGKTRQSLVLRARVVLKAAKGLPTEVIAEQLGIRDATVSKWRGRFARDRLEGICDVPDRDAQGESLTVTSQTRFASRWKASQRTPRTGVVAYSRKNWATPQRPSTRVWRSFGLQPHRSSTFTLSTDPLFVEKVVDIVGLYLNPPANAVLLCVDEKSQIQALDRTQPLLPMLPGQISLSKSSLNSSSTQQGSQAHLLDQDR